VSLERVQQPLSKMSAPTTVQRHPLAEDLEHVLAHTRPLWEELRGGRILLTGGTGFFGCWLLESFLWAQARFRLDAEVVVLTRRPAAFGEHAPHLAAHPAVRLQAGDVADFNLPEGRFTHAIHAAGPPNTPEPRDPQTAVEQALQGTRRVLEAADRSGVRKLLFTSSGAIYGPTTANRGPRREEEDDGAWPPGASWAYAEAKRQGEALCVSFARDHGLEVKIARGFAFLGPYLPLEAHLAAGNFLRDALCGGPIRVQGTGTAVRSYLYGADLAVWLWTILFRGAAGRAWNVGSDTAVSIGDLARAVAEACQPPATVTVLGQARPEAPEDCYVPDISRARRELGLEVFIPLPEAIRRTLQWHHYAQGRRWAAV
jgi:nucleoside-diphosphate-sugar epimerase